MAAEDVSFNATSVALDWGTGQMEVRGTLVRPRGGVAPDTVWVWTYFVNPAVNPSGSWSDTPIPVAPAFASGDTAAVVARGAFHWVTNGELPRHGYFARVRVSTVSADEAFVPTTERAYDTAGALRVTSRPN